MGGECQMLTRCCCLIISLLFQDNRSVVIERDIKMVIIILAVYDRRTRSHKRIVAASVFQQGKAVVSVAV